MTELNEQVLEAADEVLLAELLDCEITRAVTIRFICGVNKVLQEAGKKAVPESHMANSLAVVQLHHALGAKTRTEAFKEGKGHGYYGKQRERAKQIEELRRFGLGDK